MAFLIAVFIQAAVAVSLPPPTGPYHVGYMQHVFNNTNAQQTPVLKNNTSYLMGTIYYPTLTIPVIGKNTAPYLDSTTARIASESFKFPNGSLESLTTWNVLNAPTLPRDTLQKPTILFFPGALENAIKSNALNSELASYGYTVVALDHPGEAQFLQLPDGREGVYGLNPAEFTLAMVPDLYKMRVEDALAMTSTLFPAFVKAISAPFNATHYLALGFSLGGAVAAGALAADPSMLAGVNLDGLFVETPDVKKPFLMVAGTEHTPDIDATWSPFSENQSGWYQWLNVTGTDHRDFYDIPDWVDMLGLRNRTTVPLLGTIWGPRMDYIVKRLVLGFFDSSLGSSSMIEIPRSQFPEVVWVNGTRPPASDG